MSMKRQAWIAGITAIVGASGCGAEAPPKIAGERVGEAESALVATCPGTRQIGQLTQGGQCPGPVSGITSHWTVDRLFAGLAAPLPPALEPFCLYTWTDTTAPDFADLPTYLGAPPASWLDPDCMSVAAMTPSDSAVAVAAVTPELEQAFFEQIEAPFALPPAPNGGAPVRVAVVDAWPSVGNVGTFEHGFGMAAIARRIACGGASGAPCFMTVSPHLALDLVEPSVRNPVNGGFFGYQGRLARMIAEAVLARAALAPDDKLILNLSLGWDGRFTAGPDGLISEASIAVRTALEYAACEGALVIAAAGNAGSGPAPGAGPVFPAAWEQRLAPSCAGPTPRPLVYAVGGVNGRDLPLASVRPGARPVLAAPAFVVPGVMDNLGPDPVITGPFTGSSVAAAVASGIAASVWHRSPGLRADEVIGLLRANAVSSTTPADFCLTAPCGPVQRLSLCRSLEAAIGGPLACTKIPFGAGHDATWSAADRATVEALSTASYDGTDLVTLDSPPICSVGIYIPLGGTGVPGPYPCPSETLPNSIVAPTVGPQPPPDPCPACHCYNDPSSSTILLLAINEDVSKASPQTLTFTTSGGAVAARYDLTSAKDTDGYPLSSGLAGGNVYKVELPGVSVSFEYATIEWVNTPEAQTTSYLILGP